MFAGDVLKVSVRNQQTMSRSIIGECQLMIDQFFDGKVQEQVIPVYADQEQLVSWTCRIYLLCENAHSSASQNKTGDVRLRFILKLGPEAAAAAAEATEAQKNFQAAKDEMTIETAEAVESLKAVSFTGKWTAQFDFHVVDLGGPELGGQDVSAFKAANKHTSAAAKMRTKADVKPGAIASVELDLQKKGGSYFKGTSTEFQPFGPEGNVTGSLQRMSGKVNLQVQLVNTAGVTTSFNLVGQVTKEQVCQGTFSGCEISRNAGSVSGTFKMWPEGVEPPQAAAAPAEEAAAAAEGAAE